MRPLILTLAALLLPTLTYAQAPAKAAPKADDGRGMMMVPPMRMRPNKAQLATQAQIEREALIMKRQNLAANKAISRRIQARQAAIYAQQQARLQAVEMERQAVAYRQDLLIQAEVVKAQGMAMMGDAAQKQTQIQAAQYRLNTQRAGVPQVPGPSGMEPYGYGIAQPDRRP